ncbi:LuxR C-terminal-related transcriptional regulator [Nocardia donostiensis]|nr:LuxR C-terminal-related transcriptional regulator [Nocardia donostiensis]
MPATDMSAQQPLAQVEASRVRAGTDGIAGTAPPRLSFTPLGVGAGRLLDRAAAEPGQVVLLCGAAGTGKTTVLADWARRRGGRIPELDIRWLALTRGTNEATQLWQAIGACLGLPAAARTWGPVDSIGAAGNLIEQLTARRIPTALVIDNAHLLTDPLALAGLDYFLEHAPPTLTPILSARFDPPLRWHALAVSGRLLRIGAAELALRERQTATLLRQHGCRLTAAELAVVTRLTQGWAALVRLAAIYLSAHPGDRATALAALARPPHQVADFLVGELLTVLPVDTLRFLLVTSVPAAFTPSLAAELGEPEAARILDSLERINFPIEVTAADGQLWYAYHPMLRTYLRAELRRRRPWQLPGLHRAAARWYLAGGRRTAALPHVLADSDTQLPPFLREHGAHMVFDGAGAALFDQLDHLDRVPDLADDPYVWLLRGADAVERGDIPAATAYLELIRVRDGQSSAIVPDTWLRPFARAVSTAAGEQAGTGLDDLVPSTGHPDLDCYLALYAGACRVLRRAGGEPDLHRAMALADQAGLPRLGLRAHTLLAVSAGLHGGISTMGERARRALARAGTPDLAGLPEAGHAAAMVALAAHLRGERYHQAPESEAHSAGRHARVIARLIGFDAAADRHESGESLRTDMHRLLDTSPATSAGLLAPVVRSLLRLHAKDPARRLADHAADVLGETAEVAVARATLSEYQHRPAVTVSLLQPWLTESEQLHSVTAVTAWLLHASACDRLDRPAKVYDALRCALERAAVDRLIRPFLETAGTPELLDTHTGRFGHHDRLADTIRALARVGRTTTEVRLTETELTVLRQLPSGRTTQLVAGDLGVSINTVKTHLRGIYHKLGTASRAEAIDRARRLGLL